ncbi:hypothetical protein AVEN_116345-1 [Araneus ventricosus]|uniref:Uncharacterized protein n=1 Tax=Araneus ventricosus TaxID=182803 RepID=A0A4Y2LHJ5_ARAVE|nr:hypothetical protein AVEN_116345-1 [Araneus ventricosus]
MAYPKLFAIGSASPKAGPGYSHPPIPVFVTSTLAGWLIQNCLHGPCISKAPGWTGTHPSLSSSTSTLAGWLIQICFCNWALHLLRPALVQSPTHPCLRQRAHWQDGYPNCLQLGPASPKAGPGYSYPPIPVFVRTSTLAGWLIQIVCNWALHLLRPVLVTGTHPSLSSSASTLAGCYQMCLQLGPSSPKAGPGYSHPPIPVFVNEHWQDGLSKIVCNWALHLLRPALVTNTHPCLRERAHW